jgi:hypothetical protein
MNSKITKFLIIKKINKIFITDQVIREKNTDIEFHNQLISYNLKHISDTLNYIKSLDIYNKQKGNMHKIFLECKKLGFINTNQYSDCMEYIEYRNKFMNKNITNNFIRDYAFKIFTSKFSHLLAIELCQCIYLDCVIKQLDPNNIILLKSIIITGISYAIRIRKQKKDMNLRISNNGMNYECCNILFDGKNNLDSHIRTFHNQNIS